MNVVLSFLAGIPPRVWGAIVTVVAVLLVLWGLFSAGEAKGKEKAETKAALEISKIETRIETERARRAEVVTKAIEEDAAKIEEIENEVAALPDDDIVARARRWVRNPKTPEGN